VSRTSFKWGIPVPGDPKHVIYVWLDALANYMTALGYGSDDPADREKLERYWPADVHMIGKEIVRFHCVYWPAFLLAAELPLPRSLFAHGWLLFEESKMSKSRGNIVRSETILDTLGQDALRYFLLREIVFGQDGSFSFDALVQRFNADLANDLGNLSSRTLSMIARYFGGEIPYPSASARSDADDAIQTLAQKTIEDFNAQFEQFQFSRALETAWALVAAVNKYIVENEPWAVAERDDKDSRARLATILHTSVEALRVVTALVHPIIPEATTRIWEQLGLGEIQQLDLRQLGWGQIQAGTMLGKVEAVFPRADKSMIERMQQMEQQRSEAALSPKEGEKGGEAGATKMPATESQPFAGGTAPSPPAAPALAPIALSPAVTTAAATDGNKISIDDFFKVDLRVGEVKVAEKVKGADKLLRLEVDIGTEVRQVVAGIAKAYDPEKLVGRKVVIVANIPPRKLRGLESNGMIVAASIEDGLPVLASFLEDVPIGAKLK
jgi:methionyl-tRNA synthetase